MNATEMQIADFAAAVTDAMARAVETALRAGSDQKSVFEGTRDTLATRFGFSRLAAANMTRLIFASVAKQNGWTTSYSASDIATMRDIVAAA